MITQLYKIRALGLTLILLNWLPGENLMIRFLIINILVLAEAISNAHAINIENMGYEWSGGFSPYKYIRVYIDNDGSGICTYQTGGGEKVDTHFSLDEEYLDSLISDFKTLCPPSSGPRESSPCSDCGITRMFYTTLSDSLECLMDTIECTGNGIGEIKKKFNRLFNSEATLHALEVFSKIDSIQDDNKRFMIDDLLAALSQTASINNLYKPSRAYKYLQAIS